MRVVANGDSRRALKRRTVHNGQRVRLLGNHQQRAGIGKLRGKNAGNSKSGKGGRTNVKHGFLFQVCGRINKNARGW
jgi:hypothetical protein